MSGRFVRASKFRHVHADEPKKVEETFWGIKPMSSGESNLATASKSFVAVGKTGGGGPIFVFNQDKPGRHALDHPTINVHKGKVLDMDFNPFMETMIATASDDCHAKVTVFPAEGVTADIREPVVDLLGHTKKVMWIRFNPIASNVLMTGGFDKTVKIWDIESQAETCGFNGHTELIQSCEWNGNGSLLGTTSKDKLIRVYDPRAPDAIEEIPGFLGSKSSRICFADNENKLLVTGFSKTSVRSIYVYDMRNLSAGKIHDEELDQSAGVMIPHYDPDTKMVYIAGKGDGTIRYYEVNDEDGGCLHFLDSFRSSDPQKGVAFAPKTAVDVSHCEVQRAYRVMKECLQPLQFVVPRKSEIFQEDLYPETYAGVPMMDCNEWNGGGNAEPSLGDIRELIGAETSSAEFVAKKSPAELEKELADALARIAELEAQLAGN